MDSFIKTPLTDFINKNDPNSFIDSKDPGSFIDTKPPGSFIEQKDPNRFIDKKDQGSFVAKKETTAQQPIDNATALRDAQMQKSPEEKAAEQQKLADNIAAKKLSEPRADEPQPVPQDTKPAAGKYMATVGTEDYWKISKSIDGIKGMTSSERNDAKQAVRRIRSGEATADDFRTLNSLQQNRYMSDATAAIIGDIFNKAADKVTGALSTQIAAGEFKDLASLYDAIGSQTTLPPEVVWQHMIQSEAERYYYQSGKPGFVGSDVAYPALSLQSKIAQNEAMKTKLEYEKARTEIDTAQKKELYDYKAESEAKAMGFDSFSEQKQYDMSMSMWGKDSSIKTPQTIEYYRNRVRNEASGKTDPGEIPVAPPESAWDSFKGTGEVVRYSLGAVDSAIKGVINGIKDVLGVDLNEVYDNAVKAVAKVVPDYDPSNARKRLEPTIIQAVDEVAAAKDAANQTAMVGELQLNQSMANSLLNNPARLTARSGNDIIDRKTWDESFVASLGLSKDLASELMSSSQSSNPIINQMKSAMDAAYFARVGSAAKDIVAEGDKNREVAQDIYTKHPAVFTSNGNPVATADLSNTYTMVRVQGSSPENSRFFPLVNVSAQDKLLIDGITQRTDLPKPLQDSIQSILNDPSTYGNVDVYFGNNPVHGRVYDGSALAKRLEAAGIRNIPSQEEYDSVSGTFKPILHKLTAGQKAAIIDSDATLQNIVASPDDKKKLSDGVNELAANIGKINKNERTASVLFEQNKYWPGGGMQALPGPAKDTWAIDSESTQAFMSRIILGGTAQSEAINAGLQSDNPDDRKKAIIMVYEEMDRLMRSPVTSIAASLAVYGIQKKTDSQSLDAIASMQGGAGVGAYMKYLSDNIDLPESSVDPGKTPLQEALPRMSAALYVIANDYKALGMDEQARRDYQNKYLPAIQSQYDTVFSAIETMKAKGMDVPAEYETVRNRLWVATNTLSEDPSLEYIKEQLSRIKGDATRPDNSLPYGSAIGYQRPNEWFRKTMDRAGRILSEEYGLDWNEIRPVQTYNSEGLIVDYNIWSDFGAYVSELKSYRSSMKNARFEELLDRSGQ